MKMVKIRKIRIISLDCSSKTNLC